MVRRMTSWHRFTPSSGDDHQCSHAECSVQVADEVVDLIAIDCPAPGCPESHDGLCVFVGVAAEEVEDVEDVVLFPECSYCGARGDLAEESEDDEDLEDSDPLV